MRRARRMGAAVVLAGALATVLTTTTPATAATVDRPMVVATITIGDFCNGLAESIAFLESRPASHLRDFLLAQARRLFEKYC